MSAESINLDQKASEAYDESKAVVAFDPSIAKVEDLINATATIGYLSTVRDSKEDVKTE
mgnify:CR=1 FL=1